ncbi:hypothetical protein ACLI4U_13520 [Natrialbaceae archaeon A-CW2]
MTQKITDLDLAPHNSITLFKNGEPINAETDEDTEETTYTNNDGEEITEAYVTEGSQEAGQIQIDTRTIVPTTGYNLNWLHQRSADYTGEDKIGTEQLVGSGEDPWPHHIEQEVLAEDGENQPRHPVAVWEDNEIN